MKGKSILYSESELRFVSDNRSLPINELHLRFTKQFDRNDVSPNNLHALRKRHGWKTGRTGCFEKGNVPHNANSAGKGLMKSNKTSFTRGGMPHNWMPVGSTRTSKDGYIEIKTKDPKTWEQLHKLIWSKANGPIPDGCCVVFKDFDKKNVDLDNLELVTRNENLQINRLKASSHHKEVQPVVRVIGKLVAKTIEINAAKR